jgi:chloramphenicol 3-O-phosphotransferase
VRQVLVIIRGAAASGKTTLCESLRDFDKKIAWVSVDKLKPIFSEYKEETLDVTNQASLILVNYLLEQGYSVLFDGIFKNPAHAQEAVEIAKNKNIPVVIYQLSCSLKTLQKRDKMREGVKKGWRKPLGEELIESLYRKVEDNPIEGAIKLDTENLSPEECLRIIKKNFEEL